MNRSASSKILRNTLKFSWQFVLVAIAFMAFLPGQAFAQLTCNATLQVNATGDTPFFINEVIPIEITLGAGSIGGGNHLDVDPVTYYMDCDPDGPLGIPPGCDWGGNTVVFQGPVVTTCTDTQGPPQPIVFDVLSPNSWTIIFDPQGAEKIRNLENTSCTIDFGIMVTGVAGTEITTPISEVTGWLASEGECDNEEVAGASVGLELPVSVARTVFTVTKDFSDDNPAPVDVHIRCNDGLPLESSATITDPTAAGGFHSVAFIVRSFEPGRMDCEIWEEPLPVGYNQGYVATDSEGEGIADVVAADEVHCYYEGVQTGLFTCEVTNELDDTTLTVNKEWLGDVLKWDIPLDAFVNWTCFNVRDDPYGSLTTLAGLMEFHGETDSGSVFGIFPDFGGSSYCTATETDLSSEVETDSSECNNMPVLLGADPGPSCTIYNTVFYEGIPTLNQYGLALLALLMLGAGMAGFRKFV